LEGVFANFADPLNPPSIDLELGAREIFEKNLRRVEGTAEADPDRMPFFAVNYGPAFLPALAGAEFEWDRDTSWSRPSAPDPLSDLRIRDFDPSCDLWRSYERKFTEVQDLADGWMMSTCDMVGPFDILAGVVGSERLCIEMAEDSGDLKRLASEATRFWMQVYEAQLSVLKERHGTADVFGLYMPGRGARWSEDFIALISPRMYEEFVLPCDIRIADSLDTSYIHVHSAAIGSVEAVLRNKTLDGVEISNDPNGPPLADLISAGKAVCETGKSLMMSNWQVDLADDELAMILASLPHRGLIVTHEATKNSGD
jgi:hypothetical protein